jgi:hypothetical protein
MNRHRVLLGLRIACTAVCGLAAVLLVVLWVRSYWWYHSISVPSPARVIVQSLLGTVTVIKYPPPKPLGYVLKGGWKVFAVEDLRIPYSPLPPIPQWSYKVDQTQFTFGFPYWFAVTVFSIIAGLPWLRWRFSLRTMLIAMTLVAVVLGLVVLFTRERAAVPPIDVGDFPADF